MFNGTGVTLVDNNVTGSLITATTSSMFGASSNDRVEVVDTGLKVYESNHQVASFGNTIRVGRADEAHQTISATTTQFLDGDGSTVRVQIANDGNVDLRDSNSAIKVAVNTAGVKVLADNTSTFGLFNASGLTLVDNNVTSSVFDSTGTTIFGGTSATASLDANDISFIVGGVTGSLISSTGMEIYGASDKNERVLVNSTGVSILANNITGSSFTNETSSIFGSNDKHERVEIVGTGLKVYEDNSQVASFGSDTTITGGTIKLARSSTIFSQVDNTGLKIFDGDASNPDAFFGAGSAFIGRGSNAGSNLKSQIILETIGGKTGIRVTDKDAADVAFIGESAAIASLTSGGTPLPTTNALRGIVTDGLTANELSITGSANVGGLVASGSVRNTTNGAATAVMIHVADNSNTYFQVLNDGEVLARDNITAFTTGFTSISDKRLKEDVYPISDSLNKIVKLEPSHFTWIEKQEQDIGFIAQEVEDIIPEVIHETKGFVDINSDKQDDTTYKSISYDKLTVYLVGAIKELTKRIEDLEERFIRK